MKQDTDYFDVNCRRCQRLSVFLDDIGQQYPDYHARPVAAFGDESPDVLIVGLAPGMHGANATGRPFTGDHAGILLYETLFKFGFSNGPVSLSFDDGLTLKKCRITNAVKCLPPQNKPTGDEINTCNAFLKNELQALRDGAIVLALGGVAHNSVIKALGLKQKQFPFGHNQVHQLNSQLTLNDSYHCSRYNTQTKRLTTKMFHAVFHSINRHLKRKPRRVE
ncbi:MAG: uracil-DNA glycosylase [Gammaproteobacteria bacterium]|nr:uracil-DNA glycosylase [Gammaproteobacteria bacterium]